MTGKGVRRFLSVTGTRGSAENDNARVRAQKDKRAPFQQVRLGRIARTQFQLRRRRRSSAAPSTPTPAMAAYVDGSGTAETAVRMISLPDWLIVAFSPPTVPVRFEPNDHVSEVS